MQFDYDYYVKSAEYVKSKIDFEPEIGIILGSALGSLAGEVENPVEIPYADIPNFLTSTVRSHAGKLVLGRLSGKNVVCMSGRFHYYEGYSFEQLSAPIRLFKLLGVKTAILTNAAGAVNTSYRPGDVMLVRDHINLVGASPMRGPNDERFGERFFDVTQAYPQALRDIALSCAKASPLTVHEGVYQFFAGPQFETPSEIRAARILGADAVGMSTVTEVLTAVHCRMPVLALSLMTNMAAGVLPQLLSHEEVEETGNRVAEPFKRLVRDIIGRL